MASSAYRRTRSWICRLIIRILALLNCIAIFAFIGLYASIWWITLALAAFPLIWSLVDLVMLCIRCIPQHMTNTLLDLFCATLMAGDGGWMIWNTLVYDNFANESGQTLGIIVIFLLFSAMILHLILFAVSLKSHREEKHEEKLRGWRPESYSLVHNSGQPLMPMEYGHVNRSQVNF